jgi:hypothetical protein
MMKKDVKKIGKKEPEAKKVAEARKEAGAVKSEEDGPSVILARREEL